MNKRISLCALLAASLVFWPRPSQAVDETAAELVAEGRINLSHMIDTLNRKYPQYREAFFNVSGIAYHDFSGSPQTDVIIGLSGYKDVGKSYNNGKQLVEDAGAAFAYFHLEKDEWKLKQVELVEGKKYEGFEGADLVGTGKDQLVIYTSTGNRQMASLYEIGKGGAFDKVTLIAGLGLGPRVAQESGKPLMVDFQRALVNTCDECGVYYGRPYHWNGKQFLEASDDFLDHVLAYDPFHSPAEEAAQALSFFEDYLSAHAGDFCATANCYDLSNRLGLKDKTEKYKQMLARLGENSLQCKYCDEWLENKNKATQEEYLNQVLGRKKRKSPAEGF